MTEEQLQRYAGTAEYIASPALRSAVNASLALERPLLERGEPGTDAKLMAEIVRVHVPSLDQKLLDAALQSFYKLREKDGLRKRPSTSELIDWLLVLLRGGVKAEDLGREVPFLGVLLKKEQDLELVKQGGRFRHN